MSLLIFIFIFLWFVTRRHADLFGQMGKCERPDVDEALDVCRTEARRWK